MYKNHVLVETKHYLQRLQERHIKASETENMIQKLPQRILETAIKNQIKLVVQDLKNNIAIVIRITKQKIVLITAMFIHNLKPHWNEILVNI